MNLLNFEGQNYGPNFYELLGCDQNSSTEQICTEYKVRALQVHPDKNKSNTNASEQFQELIEAKETLTDSEMRRKYDMWLNSGMMMSWKDWINFTSKKQTVFHWVNKKSDPMIKSSSPISNGNDINSNSNVNIKESRNHKLSLDTTDDILRKFRNYQI